MDLFIILQGKLEDIKPYEYPKVSNQESLKSELVKKEIKIQKLLESGEKKKENFKVAKKQELAAIQTHTKCSQ